MFKLFISTVSFSVKVYGPVIEADNIRRMAVMIQGEDGTETELKHLTNKATEGYEMCLQPNWRGPVVGGGGVIIAPVCGQNSWFGIA